MNAKLEKLKNENERLKDLLEDFYTRIEEIREEFSDSLDNLLDMIEEGQAVKKDYI